MRRVIRRVEVVVFATVLALFILVYWPRRAFEPQVVIVLLHCSEVTNGGAVASFGITNIGRAAVTVDHPKLEVLRLQGEDVPRVYLGTSPFFRTALNAGESMSIPAWVPEEPGKWCLSVRLEPGDNACRAARDWIVSALWRFDLVRHLALERREGETQQASSPWLDPPKAANNKPAPGNAGITPRLTTGYPWPGVPEPER